VCVDGQVRKLGPDVLVSHRRKEESTRSWANVYLEQTKDGRGSERHRDRGAMAAFILYQLQIKQWFLEARFYGISLSEDLSGMYSNGRAVSVWSEQQDVEIVKPSNQHWFRTTVEQAPQAKELVRSQLIDSTVHTHARLDGMVDILKSEPLMVLNVVHLTSECTGRLAISQRLQILDFIF